jgi:hypothetical protein
VSTYFRCFIALAVASTSACASGIVELRGTRAERNDPLRYVMAASFNGSPDSYENINEISRRWFTGIPTSINIGPLDLRCAMLDATGKHGTRVLVSDYGGGHMSDDSDCESKWQSVPPGPHQIEFTARCQPPGLVEVNVVPTEGMSEEPRTPVSVAIPLPPPERRYVRPGVKVNAFTLKQVDSGSVAPRSGLMTRSDIELPPNTLVEVVRTMPDRDGICSRAFFKVLDAGGATVDANLLLGDLSDLSATPFDGLSAMEYVEKKQAKEREETAREQEEARRRADAAEKAALEEVESGRCSQKHFDQLQAALGRVSFLFDHVGSSDGFKLLTSDVIVAKPNGGGASIEFTGRGELHFFAMGDSLEAMRVTNPDGYHMSGVSQWQRLVATTGLKSTGVAFQGQAGTYRVSVKGKGCAIVMVFLKYL